jgi:hypothetical protein
MCVLDCLCLPQQGHPVPGLTALGGGGDVASCKRRSHGRRVHRQLAASSFTLNYISAPLFPPRRIGSIQIDPAHETFSPPSFLAFPFFFMGIVTKPQTPQYPIQGGPTTLASESVEFSWVVWRPIISSLGTRGQPFT